MRARQKPNDFVTMKKSDPIRTIPSNGDAHLDGILDAALEIAERRRETLLRLREALKTKNAVEVFRAAEELCGFADNEESNRVN